MTSDPYTLLLERLADSSPAAKKRGGRLAELIDLLKDPASRISFDTWAELPMTRAFVSALRELSYLPYAQGVLPVDGNAYAQYGMTLAFQTAERLLRDPESLIPVFRGDTAEGGPEPYGAYLDAPDQAVQG